MFVVNNEVDVDSALMVVAAQFRYAVAQMRLDDTLIAGDYINLFEGAAIYRFFAKGSDDSNAEEGSRVVRKSLRQQLPALFSWYGCSPRFVNKILEVRERTLVSAQIELQRQLMTT